MDKEVYQSLLQFHNLKQYIYTRYSTEISLLQLKSGLGALH